MAQNDDKATVAPKAKSELSRPGYGDGETPSSFDWRDVDSVNYVSVAKNQGPCGSCYTFVTTANIEAFLKIETNLNENFEVPEDFDVDEDGFAYFSEQQIVDCTHDLGNNGCNGGDPGISLSYFEKNALTLESVYPYTGTDDTCAYDPDDSTGILISGYVQITDMSVDNIKDLVFQQPLSHMLHSSCDGFMQYTSGIFTDPDGDCDQQIDHVGLNIGYGEDGGTEYWIVKNSWGPDWGEDGYIRLGIESSYDDGTNRFLWGSPSYPVAFSKDPYSCIKAFDQDDGSSIDGNAEEITSLVSCETDDGNDWNGIYAWLRITGENDLDDDVSDAYDGYKVYSSLALEQYRVNWVTGKHWAVCLETVEGDGPGDVYTAETWDETEGSASVCMWVTWDEVTASVIASSGVKWYTFDEWTAIRQNDQKSYNDILGWGTAVENVTCGESDVWNIAMCNWFQPVQASAYSGLRRYSQGENYKVWTMSTYVGYYGISWSQEGVVELNESAALVAASVIVAGAYALF